LIDRGGLSPEDSRDAKMVARELSGLLTQWARRWRQEKNNP
jgi:hypothetical protein